MNQSSGERRCTRRRASPAAGFTTEYHDETYAFASLGGLTVHLTRDDANWPGYHPAHHMTGVHYLHVEDAHQLAVDSRAAGANVDGPADEDYGKPKASTSTADGNLNRFGSPIPR